MTKLLQTIDHRKMGWLEPLIRCYCR